MITTKVHLDNGDIITLNYPDKTVAEALSQRILKCLNDNVYIRLNDKDVDYVIRSDTVKLVEVK